MTHPLIPQVLELAAPIATTLGLEVVNVVFHTNQNPPVLRIDVRSLQSDTGLEDCAQMSRALEAIFDTVELLPEAYVLEVSSPGVSQILTSDREFVSFRGFPALVSTSAPHDGQMAWSGDLIRRDEQAVYLSKKGRVIAIPRQLIAQVQLVDGKE